MKPKAGILVYVAFVSPLDYKPGRSKVDVNYEGIYRHIDGKDYCWLVEPFGLRERGVWVPAASPEVLGQAPLCRKEFKCSEELKEWYKARSGLDPGHLDGWGKLDGEIVEDF
jgi:hypothetical protein